MKLKPLIEVSSADEARDIAVQWQHWAAKQSLSYDELTDFQCYFDCLARLFNLTDEFHENGII